MRGYFVVLVIDMATFTTWADLKTAMENELASRQLMVGKRTVGTETIEYRSWDEWRSMYTYVCGKADEEAGSYENWGRTGARQSGNDGGLW